MVTCLREIAITVSILVGAIVAQPTLQEAAFLMLGMALIFALWNVGYIAGQAWWRKYYSGLIYSFAFRVSVVTAWCPSANQVRAGPVCLTDLLPLTSFPTELGCREEHRRYRGSSILWIPACLR